MNRLVLIGNGFDMAHSLPTKYEDFIYWYWENRTYNFLNERRDESNDGLCKFTAPPYRSVYEVAYNDSVIRRGNGKELHKYFRNDKGGLYVTCTVFFKRILNSIDTKGWVDIENEYYELLKQYANEDSPKKKIDELNNQLSILQGKLIEYLCEVNSKEMKMNVTIKNKIYAPFCENDIAIGGKSALEEHIEYGFRLDEKGWMLKLGRYGRDKISDMSNVNAFKEKYKKGEEIFDYEKREILLPNHIMLLNFNYTKTAELYVTRESGITINHIHGKLDKPESVIFGYGDELDENYKKLESLRECDGLKNIKSIKYLEAENYRKVLSFIESEPYQILIMGHSCGNSDRTLLNTLFEHKNCVSIKPYYYIKDDGSDSYIEVVQNISRNFTDMKLMRDRVVNKTYCESLTGK